MQLQALLALPLYLRLAIADYTFEQHPLLGICPDYTRFATHQHAPYSNGTLQLPSQRPHPSCRKHASPGVEKVLEDLIPHFHDPDLAKIFENAFPNTLDTTVRWHGEANSPLRRDHNRWKGIQSFVVTGDIDAEWLRDSTNQLSQYHKIADLQPLIEGAVNTQTEYVLQSPYCNAFQPPSPSRLPPTNNGQDDWVHPAYEGSVVFECKYELDSLAAYLKLCNDHGVAPKALDTVLAVLDAQSSYPNEYTFTRSTRLGTETLNLAGNGNPFANTTLIRSAFRPSDDATIFPFLIPANAMLAVELNRTADITGLNHLCERSSKIREGIYSSIVTHPIFGEVFPYESDGYGSHLLMDDANVPSLLSLPLLGFVDKHDPIYLNTRRMILSRANPYYIEGPFFSGIGGPHIGLENAWPMSVLIQALTTDNDTEIMDCLERVKRVSVFGLINESVNVNTGVDPKTGDGMTRSWFAWANSVFAQVILTLAEHKPYLILDTGKYVVGTGFM